MEIEELITEDLQKLLQSDRKEQISYKNGLEVAEFVRILKDMNSVKQLDFETVWPTSILCVSLNYPDGLGDFVNLLDISELVRKAAPKTCVVQTLAVVTEDKEKKIKFLKETHNRSDCELIVIPHSLQVNIRGELDDKAKDIIRKFFIDNIARFENTKLIFNIASVSDSLIEEIKYSLLRLRKIPSIPHITLAELSKIKKDDVNFVAMGIDSNELGVKLPSIIKNQKLNKLDALMAMNDQILVRQIFAIAEDKQPIINKEICQAYFNKTKVRYGYLQNRYIMLAFIMVNVILENNSSCEQLDFFLKPLVFDKDFLPLDFFKENNIAEIIIFNLNGKKVINLSKEGKTLRLFFLSNNISELDLLAIKTLSSEMLGGSGDSSTLDALFTSELPFIGLLDWKYKLMIDFLRFIDKTFGRTSLFDYFLHLHFLFEFNLNKHHDDLVKKFALSMGKLLQNNKVDIIKNMKEMSEMLRANSDVSDNLIYVIFYALFRSNAYYLSLEKKFFHFIKIYKNELSDDFIVELKMLLVALAYGVYHLVITHDKTKFINFFCSLSFRIFQDNPEQKKELAFEIAKDYSSIDVSEKIFILLEKYIFQFKQSQSMHAVLNL